MQDILYDSKLTELAILMINAVTLQMYTYKTHNLWSHWLYNHSIVASQKTQYHSLL